MRSVSLIAEDGTTKELIYGELDWLTNEYIQKNIIDGKYFEKIFDEIPPSIESQFPYSTENTKFRIPNAKTKATNIYYIGGERIDIEQVDVFLKLNKNNGNYSTEYNIHPYDTKVEFISFRTPYAIIGDPDYYSIVDLFSGFQDIYEKFNSQPFNSPCYYQSNYTYLFYCKNLKRYSKYIFNGNRGPTTENELNNGYMYTGCFVTINLRYPLQRNKTYKIWPYFNDGIISEYDKYKELVAEHNENPSSINDYCFLNGIFVSREPSGGATPGTYWQYIGLDGLTPFGWPSIIDDKITIGSIYYLERGIAENSEKAKERIDFEMRFGPTDTGMIAIYATPANVTGDNEVKKMAKAMWSTELTTSLKQSLFNTEEAIVSLRLMPLDLKKLQTYDGNYIIGANDVPEDVVLNGVTLSWNNANPKMYNLKYCYGFIDFGMAGVQVDPNEDRFWGHDGYSSAQLYLPYCGFMSFALDDFIGAYMRIIAIIDLYDGNIAYQIYRMNTEDSPQSEWVLLYNFNGNMTYEIPVSASNYGEMWRNFISQTIKGVKQS